MTLATPTGLSPDARPAALDHLTEGLERELALVTDLRDNLATQRAAIAAGDTDAVQQSCDRLAQVLQSMESARRVRASALEVLGVPADTPLSALPAMLDGPMPAALEAARVALRAVAEQTAADAAVHHVVLRRTVESGEAYLQALFSSASDPEPVYRTAERMPEHAAGFVLDRKA